MTLGIGILLRRYERYIYFREQLDEIDPYIRKQRRIAMKLKPYAECKDKVLISPSILSADFANLGEDIRKVSQDADTIHVDVMDGVFVPNLTIGMPVVKAIRPYTDLPIDCHLMVHDPTPFIEGFAEAGADLITVHAETCQHLHRVTQQIRQAG